MVDDCSRNFALNFFGFLTVTKRLSKKGPCRPLLFEHVCWCFFGRVVQSSWLNAKEIPIHQKQFSGNTSHSLCTPPGRKSVKTLIFIKLQFPAGKSVKILILIKLQFPAQIKNHISYTLTVHIHDR